MHDDQRQPALIRARVGRARPHLELGAAATAGRHEAEAEWHPRGGKRRWSKRPDKRLRQEVLHLLDISVVCLWRKWVIQRLGQELRQQQVGRAGREIAARRVGRRVERQLGRIGVAGPEAERPRDHRIVVEVGDPADRELAPAGVTLEADPLCTVDQERAVSPGQLQRQREWLECHLAGRAALLPGESRRVIATDAVEHPIRGLDHLAEVDTERTRLRNGSEQAWIGGHDGWPDRVRGLEARTNVVRRREPTSGPVLDARVRPLDQEAVPRQVLEGLGRDEPNHLPTVDRAHGRGPGPNCWLTRGGHHGKVGAATLRSGQDRLVQRLAEGHLHRRHA